MAMTQFGLLILALIGLVSSTGMLRQFRDPQTNLIVALVSTVVWLFFSFSATDVIVVSDVSPPETAPMYPLVFVGAAFAFVSFMVFIDRLLKLAGTSTGSRPFDGLLR